METAVLGGGCFWCLEAVFEQLDGVESVVSGYCGGHTVQPDYAQVCSGSSGHAEVVRICFDPEKLDFRTLLEVFFTIHDPTTLNRQGNDSGTQYRSVIFAQSEEQCRIAREVMRAEALSRADPIVTELSAEATFYPAEDYHQAYFRLNGHQPYCSFVVAPKLAKFRQAFATSLKPAFR